MNRKFCVLSLLSVALAVFSPVQADAAVIAFRYTGAITRIAQLPCTPGGALGCSEIVPEQVVSSDWYPGAEFRQGDEFSGVVAYDPGLSGTPLTSYQTHYGPVSELSYVTSAGFTLSWPGEPGATLSVMEVVDDYPDMSDSFIVTAGFIGAGLHSGTGESGMTLSFALHDSNGNAIRNSSLPATLNLSDFDQALVSLAIRDITTGDQLVVTGDIHSLAPIQVPVPAVAWLFFTGLLSGAGWMFRSRSSQS